jgi:hypothetical protein
MNIDNDVAVHHWYTQRNKLQHTTNLNHRQTHVVSDEKRSYLGQTFCKGPTSINLLGILPAHASVSNVSSNSSGVQEGGVDLSEGCLVTKSLKYTHQLIH